MKKKPKQIPPKQYRVELIETGEGYLSREQAAQTVASMRIIYSPIESMIAVSKSPDAIAFMLAIKSRDDEIAALKKTIADYQAGVNGVMGVK